jgi:phage gp36-like protein
MGSYATTTSIGEILPGFLKGNTTTMDNPGALIFSRYINDAEAEINAAVAGKYSMPFATVPPLLRSLAGNLAAGYAIRNGFSVDSLRRNQYLDDYKRSFELLEKLASGDMKLTMTDGSLAPVNATGRFLSSTENYTPIFGLDDPDQWTRDEDEINDQEDARA